MSAARAGSVVVGREAELSALGRFLDSSGRAPAVLVLEGEAGIGKSTVLRAALERVAPETTRVLFARPAEGEAELPYSVLTDLLAGELDGDAIGGLPAPQREALEVAVARVGGRLSEHTLARAVLELLRAFCAAGPVLLVIDDAQWLDGVTASVLAFALRRIDGAPLRVLLAVRSGETSPSELPLGLADWDTTERVSVAPLSVTELGALLGERLGVRLPRPRLETLSREANGNPMFALELAQQDEGQVSTLSRAVEQRLRALDDGVRVAAATAAAALRPTTETLLRAGVAADQLHAAVDAHVLQLEGERLVFAHPLLAAAAYGLLLPDERREVHGRLAAATDDAIERGHHVARSAVAPDAASAAVLGEAAAGAAGLGEHAAAARFLLRAAELSPEPESEEARAREVDAAEELQLAGDIAAARSLAERLLAALPPGSVRARARLVAAYCSVGSDLSYDDLLAELARAVEDAEGDDATQARLEVAITETLLGVGRFAEAAGRGRRGAELAERAGDEATALTAIGYQGIAECALGHGVPESLRRACERWQGGTPGVTAYSPRLALAFALLHTTAFVEAEQLFGEEIEEAEARGLEAIEITARGHLAQAQMRSGKWLDGLANARLAVEHARQAANPQVLNGTSAILGFAEALVGRHHEAHAIASAGLSEARATNDFWLSLYHVGTLGLIALAADEPHQAVELLTPAWQLMLDRGVGEPSMFGVPHLLGEALVAVGRADDADAIAEQLRGCPSGGQPWCEAMAGRIAALVASAHGDHAAARAEMAAALEAHTTLAEPFEHARTLQLQGKIERVARNWGAARSALLAALERFDQLGAARWSEKAAAELARLPGRRPADRGALSAREREVAELVAAGLTNKEIAARLFLSVRAVEANLSRVYGKLGIRSRTELVNRIR